MRKIICRFRNNKDLQVFANKIGKNLDNTVKEVNMVTGEIKYKKPSIKKGMRKTDRMTEWVDMPEWNLDFKDETYAKIDFLFKDDITASDLTEFFDGKMTDKSKNCWYPKLVMGTHRNMRVLGGRKHKYPIFVVSKGRFEPKLWHSSTRLSQMCVNHYLVVEPQEFEIYSKNFNNPFVKIIPMDLEYKKFYDTFSSIGNIDSTGPGAVRNFCIDLARSWGFKYCHIWDDNIDGTNYWFRGHRLLNRSEEMFASLEEFVERYSNVPLAGYNYSKFCKDGDRVPAFTINRRIYSMIFIETSGKWYFRGRYNEDTDLSLRVLKEGLCTIQFNLFLGEKLTTQRIKGGNTDEFYINDEGGTVPKTQMLYDMHPDVTDIVYKFGRIHHQVNYEGFDQKLNRIDNYNDIVNINQKINNKGMKIVKVPTDIKNILNIDNSDNLFKEYFDRNELRVDNTKIYL